MSLSPSGKHGDPEITRWELLNAPSLMDVNSGLPIHKDRSRNCSVLECSTMASKFFNQFICYYSELRLTMLGMLWNAVEGPANSFINLFAPGMLMLL
jgi:hypothetical protein